jgi:hypothetical protein
MINIINKGAWQLVLSGNSSMVYVTTNDHLFIARFKYGRAVSSARHFIKFLVANFTPEEYLAKVAAGLAPLTILEEKGYVSYNVQRIRKMQK